MEDEGTGESWRKMLLVQPPQKISWRVENRLGIGGVLPADTRMEDLIAEGTYLALD